jgi:hypothetical protein
MQIKFICPFWGFEHLSAEDFFSLIREDGYDGAEINFPYDEDFQTTVKAEISKNELVIIGQQWLPPAKESFSQYFNRFEANFLRICQIKPLFINSHTGKDYFSFKENSKLIDRSFEITKETGIPIFHETHRGRFSFHTSSLIPYLKQFPNLVLTADFSHWCNVSESLLQDQEEIISEIIPFVGYIHARIGHEQAPQVNNPKAPEWQNHLACFLNWWDKIVSQHINKKADCLYICLEFGPPLYLPVEPYSCKPLSNQREINFWMKDLLKNRYKDYTNRIN